MVSAVKTQSTAIKSLIAVTFFAIFMNLARSHDITKEKRCPGVYEVYGAPDEKTRNSVLYYISSGSQPLLDCWKGSPLAGATPLADHLYKTSKKDQLIILSFCKRLDIKNPHIQSLGI